MTTCIVGIDCATDARKVGIARGYLIDGGLAIDEILKPITGQTVGEAVVSLVEGEAKVLLAIDAPLGWPSSLGKHLVTHHAGEALPEHSNKLFRRETDKFVKQQVGKQPLDVGADRIARTAHAALSYLNEIRDETGYEIPLAWSVQSGSSYSVVEVYPSATLKQSGYRSDGYKGKSTNQQRSEIIRSISQEIRFEIDVGPMVADDDLLDAAVCILAGCHFLKGLCYPPADLALAEKEGWIWVRRLPPNCD